MSGELSHMGPTGGGREYSAHDVQRLIAGLRDEIVSVRSDLSLRASRAEDTTEALRRELSALASEVVDLRRELAAHKGLHYTSGHAGGHS